MRAASGIVSVIEQHVTLKKAGRTWKGLCPFHGEKTPSFHVDEAKGFYYCFGCQAGGDVFKFVMQQEAMSFPEAIRHLAERAGLAVPEPRQATAADGLRERIFAVNAAAQDVFSELLLECRDDGARRAVRYLEDRGITRELACSFGLGWAPDEWDFLGPELSRRSDRSARFEQREITAAGLCVARENGSGCYDRFRGRVTFPIRALSGRIVGFGGRIVGDGEPKYLNSPETPVYTKGRHLYALDKARAAIRRSGRAILVEGYLDAIALHAAGFEETVAVLGTALTPEQAHRLSRFAREVVVNFDGDAAGLRAARKSLEALLAEGLDVRVVALPDGEDPDDHVRRRGAESYRALVDAAPGCFEFLLEVARREHDLDNPAGRVAALNDLLPFVVQVDDRLLRSELLDAACHGLGIKSATARREVERALKQGRSQVDWTSGGAEAAVDATMAEKTLLTWMLADGRARAAFRDIVGDEGIGQLPKAELYRAVLAEPVEHLDVSRLLDQLEDDGLRALVSACAVTPSSEPLDDQDLRAKVLSFLEGMGISDAEDARRRKADVDRLLAEALRQGDRDEARRLLAEAQALGKAING